MATTVGAVKKTAVGSQSVKRTVIGPEVASGDVPESKTASPTTIVRLPSATKSNFGFFLS